VTGAPGQSSLLKTIWRGAFGRCPKCGARTLFRAYLKLNQRCAACGADFSRSGTADVAPYVTTLLIGLLGVPLILALSTRVGPDQDWVIAPALAAAVALALLLLPRVKGVLAALLWRAQREM
jgi:uncharacterized protein (DUF983 family)